MLKERPIHLPTETPFGIKDYATELNIRCIDVNYRADPAKRTSAWVEAAKHGKGKRVWNKDFEGDWSSTAGQPVFPEYDNQRHALSFRLSPTPGTRLVVGIDPGLSPGGAFTQKSMSGQVQLFRTIQPTQVSVLQFGSELLANIYTRAQLLELFPAEFLQSWPVPMRFDDVFPEKLLSSVTPLCELAGEMLPVYYVGDPAGMQRQTAAGNGTYFGQLKKLFKIVVHLSRNSWPSRVDTVSSLLLDGANTQEGEPLFVISGGEAGKKDTDFIKDAFAGAYAYPESALREEPPKGPHSHPMDAFQYTAMEHYPQGAGKVYGSALTTNYAALTGNAPASSGSEHAATPQATVSTVTPVNDDGEITPLVFPGENGLTTFSKPWNPFLDSFA